MKKIVMFAFAAFCAVAMTACCGNCKKGEKKCCEGEAKECCQKADSCCHHADSCCHHAVDSVVAEVAE